MSCARPGATAGRANSKTQAGSGARRLKNSPGSRTGSPSITEMPQFTLKRVDLLLVLTGSTRSHSDVSGVALRSKPRILGTSGGTPPPQRQDRRVPIHVDTLAPSHCSGPGRYSPKRRIPSLADCMQGLGAGVFPAGCGSRQFTVRCGTPPCRAMPRGPRLDETPPHTILGSDACPSLRPFVEVQVTLSRAAAEQKPQDT